MKKTTLLLLLYTLFIACCKKEDHNAPLKVVVYNFDDHKVPFVFSEDTYFLANYNYLITGEPECKECPIQIVFGLGNESIACNYDDMKSQTSITGSDTLVLAASLTPAGKYYIRYSGENTSHCTEAQKRFDPNNATIIDSLLVVDKNAFTSVVYDVNVNTTETNSATVTAGKQVSVTFDYAIWSSQNCPTCIDQIVIGLEDKALGCLYNGLPGGYPGDASENKTFSFKAPSEPGAYTIKTIGTLQFSCQAAMDIYNKNPEDAMAVGHIVVE